MFKLFNCGEKKELRELSLKQREQITEYMRDGAQREWPPLRAVRPAPIVIPPKDMKSDTPPNTPSCIAG